MQNTEETTAPRRHYARPELVRRDKLSLVSAGDAIVLSVVGPVG